MAKTKNNDSKKEATKDLISAEKVIPDEIKESLNQGKVVKKSKKKKKEKNPLHETKGQSKAIRYLNSWLNERQSWKFEKCRQIWLIQNCYNPEKISDDNFNNLLNYFGSIRGHMKTMVFDKAKKILEFQVKWEELQSQSDKSIEDIEKELGSAQMPDLKIQRAKKIVEMLE